MPAASFDNNQRRRRILFRYTVSVIAAYAITQIATLVARIYGYSSVTYGEILLVTGVTIGSTLLFLIAISLKKSITTPFANFMFFGQFAVWLVMYTVWFFTLREIRVMALFFALMALIFLLSNSNLVRSLVIAVAATIIQIAGSYVAIAIMGQQGSFGLEVFYTGCFLPSALFISYISGLYAKQRAEITQAKRVAEQSRDALWGEMELAKKIQTVLLPGSPAIPGYEITAYMSPADEVGGDYYDIINVNGMDWIAIGDVSGHGVSAGLIMMMVQTSIRSILSNAPDLNPSLLLESVNRSLADNIKKISEDKYMTITVLAAHREGRFVYSGLHQDIMIHRAARGTVEIVETDGMWLGILENLHRMNVDQSFTLDPGDAVLLYTDGITEALNERGEMFTSDRLAAAFQACGDRPVDEIKTAILDSMAGYRAGDDLTLVIIRHLAR